MGHLGLPPIFQRQQRKKSGEPAARSAAPELSSTFSMTCAAPDSVEGVFLSSLHPGIR
jgi:hypothetical protein